MCYSFYEMFISTLADLFEPCLVPTCLARDNAPCVWSISWSQEGFAPNSGYLSLIFKAKFTLLSCCKSCIYIPLLIVPH
jgi:hypothetical protein